MIAVIEGGLQTTVQDFPGRVGYWNIGIPPSGPMDPLAFRVANRLVGNGDDAAGLEITAKGPKLFFLKEATIALTGAELHGDIGGKELPWWEAIRVKKGDTLTLGTVKGSGFRSYLSIAGGFDVPLYLGSKATFPYGRFGGYEGRPLQAGDLLAVNEVGEKDPAQYVGRKLPYENRPNYAQEWNVGVVPGPHEAPDFFTFEDLEVFYGTPWFVHHNSNRLGYRLEGPRLQFARTDGGEGGRHPSNVNDCAYAIGTVNFTGDLPVILAVDGPSLGGFVSIATVVTSEFWKVGQAAAGNYICFKKMSYKEAYAGSWEQEKMLHDLSL
jgi:urea carboxylase